MAKIDLERKYASKDIVWRMINLIKEKVGILYTRGKPKLHSEYEFGDMRYKKKLYDYYICDYCGERINMSVPKNERTGGTMSLSYIVTRDKSINIAVCNKHVNKVLAEFERSSK